MRVIGTLPYCDAVAAMTSLLAPSFSRIQAILSDPARAAGAAAGAATQGGRRQRLRPPLYEQVTGEAGAGDGLGGHHAGSPQPDGSSSGSGESLSDSIASLACELGVVGEVARFAIMPRAQAGGLAGLPGTPSDSSDGSGSGDGSGNKHPAVLVLESVWPALQSAAASYYRYSDVVAGCMGVLVGAAHGARAATLPLLREMISLAVNMFNSAAAVDVEQPACLAALGSLVQTYGSIHASEPGAGEAPAPAADTFSSALAAVCGTLTAMAAAEGGHPSATAGLYAAFFGFLGDLAVLCPDALASAAPALSQALHLAVGVLGLPERAASVSVAVMARRLYNVAVQAHSADGGGHAAAHAGKLQIHAAVLRRVQPALEQAAGPCMAPLLKELLHAAVHTAPPDACDSLADAAFEMLRAFPANAEAALAAAVGSEDLPASPGAATATPELRRSAGGVLLQLALAHDVSGLAPQAHTLRDRIEAFRRYVGQLANVCRGQAGAEALGRALTGDVDD
jgi:hypothetical protein